VLISTADSSVTLKLQVQLFGQLLPQQGGAVQLCVWHLIQISSAIQYLPCFGGCFLLCLFTRVSALGFYFFALPPFSGVGSVFYQLSLLSMFYDSLLFAFQFCEAVWFWVLLSGSEDELCDPLPALLCGVAYCLSAVSHPAFLVFVCW
jgi:hypothetical protein